ncbi:glycosyl hydrolase [Wenyingzhuangia sp. IMCC45574]
MKFTNTILSLLFCCSVLAQHKLIDKRATKNTKKLYYNLQDISSKGILFGHHSTNLEGIGWKDFKGTQNKSDVKLATGDFPAVYSFDFIRGFEQNTNAVKIAYEHGAIITFSWHMKNLATWGKYKDTIGFVMQRILPDGDLHVAYKKNLDKVASFAKGLKDKKGKRIPIIFRPFHENTGSWFWWGKNHCTPEEYKKVWQFTVNYLRKKKRVHNLIYAYSPSRPVNLKDENYETRYPGNDYVDIIGFDHYGKNDFSDKLVQDCRLVVEFAEKNGKVAAMTEFGVMQGIQNTKLENWYIDAFLNPIKKDPVARKIAYVVTWANRKHHRWIPLQNDIHYKGFVKFYQDDFTWFLSELNNYRKKKKKDK